jgi:hypothetical protein
MLAPRQSRRCWFCGERHLADGDPPEHIIPAALGAELTTDAVAKSCNERAGREVDIPLIADIFVAFNRVFYDIRDRRGRKPPNPVRNATLEDGTPVSVETREIPWRMTPMPKIHENGDKMTLKVSSVEEAEEIIAKKSERTGQNYRVVGERRYGREDLKVEIPISLDLHVRIRSRAKMVLGTLSKVFPEDWLDTDDAKQLQEWLWDPRPKKDGEPIGAMHAAAEGHLSFVCEPPEHLVALMPGGNSLTVMIMLFGKEVLPYEVSLPDIEAPEDCWVVDPKKRKVRHMKWIEQVHEVGRRLDRNQKETQGTN